MTVPTFIGAGTIVGDTTVHTTRPNLMANYAAGGRLKETTRQEMQQSLRRLLASGNITDAHNILDVTVNIGGDVYVEVRLCADEERAAAIQAYLQALEALELHDREHGVTNYAVLATPGSTQ